MRSNFKRASVAVTAVAILSAAFGVSAAPVGARVVAKNAKFCEVLGSDQGAGIDFEGLGPDEAKFGAKLMRKLAKTGVPAKLKKDLKKVAKVYARIGKGEPATEVLDADGQAAVLPAITRFSKYVGANCVPTAPAT
jgi:hypothetical protein